MSGFRVRQIKGSPLWSIGASYFSRKLQAAARNVPGLTWDVERREYVGYIDAIEPAVLALREMGLTCDDPPENKRKWPHNLPVSYESAREYQKEGIDFLVNQARSGALLADDMGCIDGDAIVQVSRGGASQKMKLSELHFKFNGGVSRGRAWRKDVPTLIGALHALDMSDDNPPTLGSGALRLQKIRAVIDKGVRDVRRLTLKSGKTLRLTPDHEVAAPRGYIRASRLRPGMKVLVNGAPRCKRCGSAENVCTTPSYPSRPAFTGYCRKCIYRYLRGKPTFKGGKSLDKDGYVRVSGMHDHPRANRHGQVLEHHLVMEHAIGRRLHPHEVVHHENGRKNDNRIQNLVLTDKSGHARIHGEDGGYMRLDSARGVKGGHVRFVPVEDEVISNVRDGQAHVYDVVCEDPYRNFVANGIVVHNCGKSLQAVKAARALRRKTIIVCPAHVRGVWERPPDRAFKDPGGELAKWWPKAEVHAPYGVKPHEIPEGTDVVVIHYDIVHAWVEVLLEWAEDDLTIIFDEAHILLNPTSRRSTACRELARAARGRMALTGTPPTDRVRDLFNIIDTISPGRMGEFFGFAVRYCDAHKEDVPGPDKTTKTIWNFDGKSNLKELRKRLDWFCLRRTKREVLDELPALQRQIIDVRVPPKNMLSVNARLVGDKRRMRMALDSAADGKLKNVISLVKDHLEAGSRVVVGTYRRAVCEKLADALNQIAPTSYVHGGIPLTRRPKIIDKLKHVKGPCCLVANIDCASTGIDLTFASVVVMAELVWEPRDLAQFEARAHRFGQEEKVIVQYVIARGTGDELILQAVIHKLDSFLDLVETDKGDGLKEALEGEKDEGLTRLAAALRKMGAKEAKPKKGKKR